MAGAEREGAATCRPIPELTDPFTLGVHHAITVDPARADLSALPPYIRRRHDEELARVVAQAAAGRSVMAVLVGESSTGKTRACWEALHQLPQGWSLWQPSGLTPAEDLMARLPQMGLRTVVWLDETQLYLDTPDDTGERVAVALRALLAGSRLGPVLVLGTMWPAQWSRLTQGGTPHGQARALLADTDIWVPSVFTGPEIQDLRRASVADTRLKSAAAEARDGQVSQYLAGVPELLARYRHAPADAKALIHTAMDARRLGHGAILPLAFLEAAAPAYLSDIERDALGEDWLKQALAYTTAPARGAAGPLTRVPSRPARHGMLAGDTQRAEGPGLSGGPLYRLADYLDQHGRYQRKSCYPPTGFWAAAAVHTFPGDQAALGDAGHARGLYRDAAQLHKNAAAHGNRRAVFHLINPPDHLRAEVGPVLWAAAHTTLDDPAAVAGLLVRLPGVGAHEQVGALLRRDPAAHVSLRDPFAVAGLLVRLHGVGAYEQVAALAERAAADVSLGDPFAVAGLLDGLRGVGLPEQVAALADRAAADMSLDDPAAVADLVDGLRGVGAHEQVGALLRRDPAAHVSLRDPFAVAGLLVRLHGVGAYEQVAALAERAAADVSLGDPFAVAGLLDGLRGVGLPEQVAALADRAAADVSLGRPAAVAGLLDVLRGVGALGQVSVLADRAAADVSLDDPAAVAELLDRLAELGAVEQVSALLRRDPAAHVCLDRPAAVAWLLDGLSGLGAVEQVSALADRSAAQVSLHSPFTVAQLLDQLGEVGAPGQVSVLADRAAAGVALDDPAAVARLLGRLRGVGALEQVSVLADRAAAGVSLDDPAAVAGLLDRLAEAGALEQLTALVNRLPAEGMFDLFQDVAGTRFRFGRAPDGRSAEPWGWADLR